MQKFWLVLLFSLAAILSYGQTTNKPLRLELETAKDEDDYRCLPIGEKGVVVFYEGNLVGSDSSAWILMHYDVNLQKINNIRLVLPANVDYLIGKYEEDHLHLIFQDKYQKKTVPKTYYVDLDINTSKSIVREIKELSDVSINFMKLIEQSLLLISYENEQYRIYIYDIETDRLSTPQLTMDRIVSIEFCEVDTFQRRINWGLILTNSQKNTYIQMVVSDYEGRVIRNERFPSYTGYYFNRARFTFTDSLNYLIIGTYTDENDKYTGNLYSGVYTIASQEGKMGDPVYYAYASVKSKDTLSNDKSKKKQNTPTNLQELIGDITHLNGQYAFVSEVFYPEYSYNSNPNYYDPYYYNYYSNQMATFAGYRYLNAYIITFDKGGNLLWTNYLPFSNMLTKRLLQRVNIHPFEDFAVIYYPFSTEINFTMVSGAFAIEPLTSVPIVTLHRSDKVDYTRGLFFEQWYDNCFIAYGYQYIRNNSKSAKSKRYVFFINKFEYR